VCERCAIAYTAGFWLGVSWSLGIVIALGGIIAIVASMQ
jgi:hypothetical protein